MIVLLFLIFGTLSGVAPCERIDTDPAVGVPEGELNVGVVGAQLGRRGVLEVVLGPEPHSGDRMSTARDKIWN